MSPLPLSIPTALTWGKNCEKPVSEIQSDDNNSFREKNFFFQNANIVNYWKQS